VATSQRLLTAEDLDQLPRAVGERRRLVEGVLIQMSPGNKRHGLYAMRLSIPLGAHIYAHGLGEVYAAETGFLLATNPDTVQGAEFAYARQERADAALAAPGPWWPGAPDLAVEVASPNDTFSEINDKVETWLAHETRVVVVIEPRRQTVTVWRPTGTPGRSDQQVFRVGDDLTLPDLFPGWSLPVAAIFGPRPPR
jgi:Uma2 family endonuclease